jgi:hypothetical protein
MIVPKLQVLAERIGRGVWNSNMMKV